jgi:putative membrane protein
MVTMRNPLTSAERERVHAATVAVESRTSAIFALAIVPVSERYLLFPLVWGAVLALAVTGVLALIRPDLGIGLGFVINAALFIVLSLILDWLPLRLLLVPRRARHAHARQLAHREFAARILANAQHLNG